MRAIASDGHSLRFLSDHPEPPLAPGEALVKPTRALLTPSDFLAAAPLLTPGHSSSSVRPFAGVLGHQFVGIIKKVHIGTDTPPALAARKSWVGRRVVPSTSIPCGNCDLCRRALSAHCRSRRVPGIAERDGCLADLIALPLGALHLVPETVSDDNAMLAGFFASAAHTANLLRAEERSFTTVLGDSVLALITALVLARANARVRLLSARPEIASVCERWGIKQRSPDEPGRRQDQDVVVDCAATSASLRLALQMVRPRGMIVLKSPSALAPFRPGSLPPPAPEAPSLGIDLTPAIANEVHIVGSREGPMPDGLALLKQVAPELPAISALLTGDHVPFEHALPALRAIVESGRTDANLCVDLAA